MKCFPLFLLLLLSTPVIAQTYYYERVKTVRNGRSAPDSGDGHYITFNGQGCYDSDSKGITSGTGFRSYKSFDKGIYKYFGKSYFGPEAYYLFSQDKSRLNIKMDREDVVYVYERKSAPSSMNSLMRGYRDPSSGSGSGVVTVGVPIVPTMPSSSGVHIDEPSKVHVDHTCKGCHGTGLCTLCNGLGKVRITSSYPEFHVTYVDCKECNGTGRCVVCHGKGRFD